MSSPFTIFRKHQRVMMVVITGLSMISFVLLGAVQDPTQLPVPLIVIFMAALIGGVAWLAGLNSGKATEWGLTGLAGGAVVAAAIAFSTRQASAVYIDNGNLSAEQVMELQGQRYIVNRFVNQAFQETFNASLQQMPAQIQRHFLFGFSNLGEVTVDDVVVGELLRREADKMKIVVTSDMAWDFIKQLTSKAGLEQVFERYRAQMNPQEAAMMSLYYLPQLKAKTLTADAFTKLRQSMRVSEKKLIDSIRDELKIRQAYQLLAGNNYFPPEQFWSYYQKLNVKQTAEIATIPVKDFVDPNANPSDADLMKLFEQYRNNFPGYTATGDEEPGRPGFYQPRRFQLGYLEADYEKIEPLVGEVTDAEIQKLYEDRYLKKVPEGTSPSPLEGPDLPPAPTSDKPEMSKPDEKPVAPATPPSETSVPTEKPAGDQPPLTSKPATEKPATEKPDAEKPTTNTPAINTKSADPKPAEKTPATEKPAAPKTEEKPAPDSKSSSSLLRGMTTFTQTVAFLADDPASSEKSAEAVKPAEPQKPDEKPASSEKPVGKTADQPATKAPEAEKPKTEMPDKAADKPKPDASQTEKSQTEKSAADAPKTDNKAAPPTGEMKGDAQTVPPPAPKSDIPPLDDALKAQLRSEILKGRTAEAIQKRIEAAQLFMGDISTDVTREKTEAKYLTLEQATKKLQDYAAEHQLQYVVLPLLSYEELATSEDYPIGQASTGPQRFTVADSLMRTSPTDMYRVYPASDFTTSSAYVFWKLSDKAAYAPITLDDEPGLRDQVAEAWSLGQATPKAIARAEELAKQVRDSDQPMATVLAEQTVTGAKGSLFVPIRATGDFTWMQSPLVPATGMMQSMPVRPSVIPGAPDAGKEFFEKVFDDLKVGDVGIAPGNDHTNYYIVKILSRDPSTPEQLEAMHKKFLAEGTQVNGYSSMLQQTMMQNSVNWLQQLFDEHGVKIMQRDYE